MILQLEYQNGEKRNVQLHPLFFTDTIGFEKGRQSVLTPESKAIALANYLGANPYKIIIAKGGDIYMRKVNLANNPNEAFVKTPKVDERNVKKQLRKQFKNIPFKYHYKLGEEIKLAS